MEEPNELLSARNRAEGTREGPGVMDGGGWRVTAWLLFLGAVMSITGAEVPGNSLSTGTAAAWARLALRCVGQEYPNKMDHVMNSAGEVLSPKTLHPSFYGCFDWHSSVHGHWMLVRLIRLYPEMPEAAEIRRVLGRSFARENIEGEVRYLEGPNRKSFERTYGWAWLLKLAAELRTWGDPEAQRWSRNLEPLTAAIVKSYQDFLPRQRYPIRTGVHPNTAFGLALALDYARAAGQKDFEGLLVQRARYYFEKDQNYPAGWEPGGEDFFSPALMEADLMRRVLPRGRFQRWFKRFLPRLGGQGELLKPAEVTDRSDPKLVHLDGLNLSRAWCMAGIAKVLRPSDPERQVLEEAASGHLKATLPEIASGHYEGEHWLATFAVYALSEK